MRQNQDGALQQALLQIQLPPGITVRAWREEDFPAIQRLSELEGWPTPLKRPDEALAGWHKAWPALLAVADGAVIGFLRALSDGNITTYRGYGFRDSGQSHRKSFV